MSLSDDLRQGDRRALSKAITLIESNRADHRRQADDLLHHLLPYTGKSKRIGLSGPPGAGKSTLIETLGLLLLKEKARLAILAIDPVSPLSGGSILGDKTRMVGLSAHPDVFIRPSPGKAGLGGIAARSREVMLLCEAAGFDWVIVETIGSGQSEIAVADMTDMFIALIAPGGGDELQGMKRGIMELADLLVITKADGDLLAPAERIKAVTSQSLRLLRSRRRNWQAEAILCSSYEKRGVDDIVAAIDRFFSSQAPFLKTSRAEQAVGWFHKELAEEMKRAFLELPGTKKALRQIEEELRQGRILPSNAARHLIQKVMTGLGAPA